MNKKSASTVSIQPLIMKVEGLKKEFFVREKTINVLDNIKLLIHAGELVSITGASGSGKSTLLNLLAGIDFPTEGEIVFLQESLTQLNETQLSKLRCDNVGFIFQQHNLIKELTVLENILLPSMIHPHYRKFKKEKESLANYLLSRVDMIHRIDHYVGELSGGESQRVAIARSFINNPKLILADEPTGNLDAENSLFVFKLLSDFARSQNTAIIMVTHSIELSKQCDSIYILVNGNLKKVKKK